MTDLPRVLLLTAWRASGRYAGAEAIRRILRLLPAGNIRWASLDLETETEIAGVPTKGFSRRDLHWRLREGLLDFLYRDGPDARRLVSEISGWVEPFAPDVLWVLPELQAIPVALRLADRLRIGIHATAYDAPENAMHVCVPPSYAPLHMRLVRKLYHRVASVDTVSNELADYLRAVFLTSQVRVETVPASFPRNWLCTDVAAPEFNTKSRRISFCGEMRTAASQWAAFLEQLSQLPYSFEVLAYAASDRFPVEGLPENVSVKRMPYVESEEALVASLAGSGSCFGYVGLPREGLGEHFARTSLSSKLSAYAAAGLPIMVDGTESCAGWQLVKRYGAGARVTDDKAGIAPLIQDADAWHTASQNAIRLAAEHFVLEDHIPTLTNMLTEAAARRGELAE